MVNLIPHLPERRPGWSESQERKPQKKALLIGIQYERDQEDGNQRANALKGPHEDVKGMKKLLMDQYSYMEEDIVVLIDDDAADQPTRENILRAIKRLVEDARSGDHFFFHYAGHAVQIENRTFSEEDGLDECIIPSDGEDRMIKDNELRRLLVDSLPIGSNLTAIFDSCHSASLLDLEHFRCNRVYVPWVSKGKRRSDTRWNRITRRHACSPSLPNPDGSTREQLTHVLSRRIFRSQRISATSRRTSRDEILISASTENRRLTIRTRSLSPEEKWFDTPHSPIKRCMSPESMWPCTGDCPPLDLCQANVVSVSACKDYQLSWEDIDGASMTQALIKILREDKHPTLRALLTKISHELHKFYVRLHEYSRTHRREVRLINERRAKVGRPPIVLSQPPEMNNFQAPQISTHVPLRPDARWNA